MTADGVGSMMSDERGAQRSACIDFDPRQSRALNHAWQSSN
jgi:hypothetical protein